MSSLPHWVAYNSLRGPASSPWLSQVILAGETVYISGVVGKKDDGTCVEGGIEAQTKRALEIVQDRLSIVGLDLTDVVNVMVHLSSLKTHFAGMNKAYMVAFGSEREKALPTRTCVGAELSGNFDVEFTVTARLRRVIEQT